MRFSRRCFWLVLALVPTGLIFATEPAARPANKKLLLVTHSGGFVHDSVGVAEDVLTEIGPKHGYDVTCFRFTGDPTARVKVNGKTKADPAVEMNALEAYNKQFRPKTGKPVEKEHCGRLNAETLKKYDCVLFFTTGDPVTGDELKELLDWVKAGGAFAGTHCATDTLFKNPEYGDMIGAYFRTHPAGYQKVKLKFEDPKHPAATGFEANQVYEDEIYIFRDQPYSRDKLHIIFSAQEFNPGKSEPRKDQDYAISWCKEYGKGKVFYTSLGHKKDVWKDPKFQAHLFGGLKWSTNDAPGDATPTNKIGK
ncbi:MAG: ThuA domain-containing protein [Fimbriiglobus sp.]